jgi:hypothetical protein
MFPMSNHKLLREEHIFYVCACVCMCSVGTCAHVCVGVYVSVCMYAWINEWEHQFNNLKGLKI